MKKNMFILVVITSLISFQSYGGKAVSINSWSFTFGKEQSCKQMFWTFLGKTIIRCSLIQRIHYRPSGKAACNKYSSIGINSSGLSTDYFYFKGNTGKKTIDKIRKRCGL